MVRGKLSILDSVHLLPTKRTSVLSLLSFRKFNVNQTGTAYKDSYGKDESEVEKQQSF